MPTPPRTSSRTKAVRRRAKVFWTGRSQAIRLPKEFRFATPEVDIHRDGDRVIIEPVEVERDQQGWPRAWWDLAGAAPELDLGNRGRPLERDDVFTKRR